MRAMREKREWTTYVGDTESKRGGEEVNSVYNDKQSKGKVSIV